MGLQGVCQVKYPTPLPQANHTQILTFFQPPQVIATQGRVWGTSSPHELRHDLRHTGTCNHVHGHEPTHSGPTHKVTQTEAAVLPPQPSHCCHKHIIHPDPRLPRTLPPSPAVAAPGPCPSSGSSSLQKGPASEAAGARSWGWRPERSVSVSAAGRPGRAGGPASEGRGARQSGLDRFALPPPELFSQLARAQASGFGGWGRVARKEVELLWLRRSPWRRGQVGPRGWDFDSLPTSTARLQVGICSGRGRGRQGGQDSESGSRSLP